MNFIHQKKFFLFILTIFILTVNISQCMDKDNVLMIKKYTDQEDISDFSTKEESFEKTSSSEDSSIKEPPHKRQKINTLEKKEKLFYQKLIQDKTSTIKLFPCNYENCNKICKRKADLKKHMIVHSKERPYQCNYKNCNKTFKYNNVLQRHIAIHKRPYQCKNCGKTFKHQDKLHNHIIIHINKKSYLCDYKNCNKTYLTKSALNAHIHTVHENIRYSCSQCKKSYTTTSSLNCHIKKFHNKQ